MYTLEFSNINYEVKKGGGKKTGYKTILNGLDGKLVGGEFTAIIGSSGSGKTTLLNILSGRIISGKLSGQVLFNGEKRVPQQFKRDVAYVEQEDLLYSGLTVQETLAYAAGFRLNSREYTKSEKMARADAMIQDLMLDKCKNSLVHDVNSRGISGGEKKRTSIGVEILSDPKLIMLDEPTSGLDSSNAETLVRLMKKITKDNDIISVASIHQPSARVFNLFDNVIILCSGKIIYSGPVNKSINYFASIGYSCPQYENPADFFINLITVDTQSPESIATSNERVKALIAGWDENNDKLGDLPVKICSKDVTPENFETVLGFKNSDMTSGLLEFCGEPKAKEYTEFDPRGIFSGNELGSSTDDEKQLFIKGKPVSMAGTGTGAGTGTQVELEIVSPPVARMEGDTPGGARSVGMLPSSTDTEFGKESKGGKALSETVVSSIIVERNNEWNNKWFLEEGMLLRRSWLRQLREKEMIKTFFISGIATMVIIGFTFFKPGTGYAEAQNKIGLIFLVVVNLLFPIVMPMVPTLIVERNIMLRERASRTYRGSSYIVSVVMTKLPVVLASSMVMLTGIYFLTKFQYVAYKYFIFIGVAFTTILCSFSFAMLTSALSKSVEIAAIIAPLVLSLFLIYGGNLVNSSTIPAVLGWLQYVSYVYYSYCALMQNEFSGRTFDCSNSGNTACYPTGEAVLNAFNISKVSIGLCVVLNLVIAIVFFAVAYFAMRFKTKPKYIWV